MFDLFGMIREKGIKMINKITKTDLCMEAETLKDVVWYLKGMIDNSKKEDVPCVFDNSHINALQEAINLLQLEVKNKED